jgi:hypothetical protein
MIEIGISGRPGTRNAAAGRGPITRHPEVYAPAGRARALALSQGDPELAKLLLDAWYHGLTVEEYLLGLMRPRIPVPYYRRIRQLGDAGERYLRARPPLEERAGSEADPVVIASLLSIPASDPPAWTPVCHYGAPAEHPRGPVARAITARARREPAAAPRA